MLFTSTLAQQASGSIGGLTFSHNAGGTYVRARVTPTDPATPFQQLPRALMAAFSNLWVNVLSAADRLAWETYAANVPRPNALGQFRTISGLAMFVRSNIPRTQADPPSLDLPFVQSGPTIFDVGDFTLPTATITPPATTVNVSFTEADAWVSEDQAAMLTWWSRPQNPTINFFKGPYRSAGFILGQVAIPPTSPTSIALPFAIAAGQQLFGKLNVTRADGRLGNPVRIRVLSL